MNELQKIDNVQESAQAAFTEANNVNKKIESIGIALKDDTKL